MSGCQPTPRVFLKEYETQSYIIGDQRLKNIKNQCPIDLQKKDIVHTYSPDKLISRNTSFYPESNAVVCSNLA